MYFHLLCILHPHLSCTQRTHTHAFNRCVECIVWSLFTSIILFIHSTCVCVSNYYLSALPLSIIHKQKFHTQEIIQKQTKTEPTRSQEAIRSTIGHPVDVDNNGDQCDVSLDDDSMEIVVVSDTVRQRRSRTPLQSPPSPPQQSSSTARTVTDLPAHNYDTNAKPKQIAMPDLLPKTFHLAETCALFSQIDNAQNSLAPSPTKLTTPPPPPQRSSSLKTMRKSVDHDYENVSEKVSVVEIRAVNLTAPTRAISTYHTRESLQCHNIGQRMNTCSILESIDYIEPSQVETVHIVDVSSEPSDSETRSSTPNPTNRTKQNNQRESLSDDDDDDDDDQSDANEYETGEPAMAGPQPKNSNRGKMQILRQQISCEGNRKSLQKDRDLLKDSEIECVTERRPQLKPSPPPKLQKPQRIKLTPTLKEILSTTPTDCDQSAADKFEEPLVFSDDDDDDVNGDTVDDDSVQFNRDTVFFFQIEFNDTQPTNKQKPQTNPNI